MAIELVAYDSGWSRAFNLEALALCNTLGESLLAVHHMGSTAIPGMLAKPVIDILGVATSLAAVDAATPQMQALGYAAKGNHGIEERRYFQKQNHRGERTHHVHVYRTGDVHIERHLAFRDYLRAHPAIATRYADVKRSALAALALTRLAYQASKEPFILAIQAEALRWYHLQHRS